MDIERLEKILANQKVKSKKFIYISSLTIALLATGIYDQQGVSADQVSTSETSKVQGSNEETKGASATVGTENDEQKTSATIGTTPEESKQVEINTSTKDTTNDLTAQDTVKENPAVNDTNIDNSAKDDLVEQKRDNHWYLVNETTGQQMTGFQELKNQNKTVYYSPENGQMQYGWQDIKNNKYYFDTYNGAMTTGQKNIDGNWYLFNNEGQMQRGFQDLKDYGENKTVYYSENGQMQYGQQKIDGAWYNFDAYDGAMKTGLVKIPDQNKTVYYAPNGQMQYGWQSVDNATRYFDTVNGAMATGQKFITGHWYLFDNNGAMQRGFQNLKDYGDNKTVYYNQDGWMQYGWQWLDNATRYFDTFDGAMAMGQKNIANHWYLFDKAGAMQRGFQNLKDYGENKTAYYNQDGWMQYGWQWLDNATHYFDTYDGAMAIGQKKIDDHWYLFDKNGAMQRGFQNLKDYGDNKTVYYNQDGWMLYGWQWLNNATRYLDTFNGAMATGQKMINGHWYLFDNNGAMQRGIQYIPEDNKLVYYNQDGWMLYGKQNINGVDHNFNTFNGALEAKGQVKVGDNWYLFNNAGVIQTGFQDLKAYGQDKVVYYDPKTATMVYGYQNIDGNWYLFTTLIPMMVQWRSDKRRSMITGIYLIRTVQCNEVSKISKIMVTTKRFIITKMVGCNMVGSG